MATTRGSARKAKQPAIETSPSLKPHLARAELYAQGKALREKCPRSAHAAWKAGPDRPEPLHLLEKSSKGRIAQLLPIRYGRMLQSPFTFYRGAALNMAADLATTPVNGLRVQACGDCHLANFGAFATPERRLIFDINDLDETLPAPWEWDVKRLAASFVLACRNSSMSDAEARTAALSCVRSYREHMADFSDMRVLDVWYARIDVEKVLALLQDDDMRKRSQKRLEKAKRRNVLEHDFPQLATTNGLAPAIKENPPLIYHPREQALEEFSANVTKSFAAYRETLPEDRRLLLDRYKLMDIAMKVVGVGSVGTACSVALMMAGEKDPLFLQLKQALPSVLEAFAGKSAYANHGQRVVVGCRLMQSASDLFLGWTEGQLGRHFYVRQLRDMKIKPLIEVFTADAMKLYAETCGWTLARAHARSGEPARIAGYLGKGDAFDEAVASFAVAYADQSERDHELLTKAVRDGRLEVFVEE
jgi:uncharacterized protein (DUF2252 family)